MSQASQKLRKLMADRGLSLEQAAKALGCHFTYVSQLRSGKRKPSRQLAARIEELSADWPDGPIRAGEWDEPGDAAAA